MKLKLWALYKTRDGDKIRIVNIQNGVYVGLNEYLTFDAWDENGKSLPLKTTVNNDIIEEVKK